MDLVANYKKVSTEMKGRLACPEDTAVLLQEMILKYSGDYVEIGSLFGGSLVLAALVCEGDVYAIDPLNGYYRPGKKDATTGLMPSKEIILENLETFGVGGTVFAQKHPPWPEALKDHQFGVGFIDGDHTYEGCRADYNELKSRCRCLVLDNYEKPTIIEVVREIKEDGWRIVGEAEGPYEGQWIKMVAVSRE